MEGLSKVNFISDFLRLSWALIYVPNNKKNRKNLIFSNGFQECKSIINDVTLKNKLHP